MNQRILVCGGRHYTNRSMMFTVLDLTHEANPVVLLVHGMSTGADSLASEWAHSRKVPQYAYVPNWFMHGRSAGPIRNRRMLVEGAPDLVIAFPGGRGTANMVSQALAAGVPVTKVQE